VTNFDVSWPEIAGHFYICAKSDNPSGILDTFNAWLKRYREIAVSQSIKHSEAINGDIADKFFEKNNKAN
jgi:hypothetical protein